MSDITIAAINVVTIVIVDIMNAFMVDEITLVLFISSIVSSISSK